MTHEPLPNTHNILLGLRLGVSPPFALVEPNTHPIHSSSFHPVFVVGDRLLFFFVSVTFVQMLYSRQIGSLIYELICLLVRRP